MSKKKTEVKFKRHEIKEPTKDSIKELVNLYKAAEDESSYLDSEKKFFHEEADPLKKLIEKKRAKRKKTIWGLVIIFLFFLAGSALAGFLYFSGHRTFNNENLSITIQGPEKTKLGEKIDYQIKYENIGDVALEEARINIQLPKGFILERSDPEIINKQIDLKVILIRSTGYINISGHFIDDISHEQKIVTTMYFVPSNFNSEFSKEASLSTLLELPELDFNINYPASVTLGQKFNIKIEPTNATNVDFEKLKLELVAPQGFQTLSNTPKAAEETNTWFIDNLIANTKGTEVQTAGNFINDLVFSDETEREKPFKIRLLIQDAESQYTLLAEKEILIRISDQPIQAYLIINGSTDNKNVSLSKILTYSLVIKNTGADTFEDLIAKTIIKSSPVDIIDWEKISDNNYGQIETSTEGKLIIWTGADIKKLETFKTKEEVTINFSVPIKSLDQLKSINAEDLDDTQIESISEIYTNTQSESVPSAIKSNPVNIFLNSNIDLETKALYYFTDGTPIGSGPFPPEVGQKTQLTVFWDLTNDLHEMQNIEITSTLPKYVTLVGTPNATIGQISFSEESNTLSWKINTLPKTIKEANCTFNVEFIPTDKQKGKFLQLTGNTTMTAKDAQTNDTIIKTKNIITTALEADEFVTEQGLVK